MYDPPPHTHTQCLSHSTRRASLRPSSRPRPPRSHGSADRLSGVAVPPTSRPSVVAGEAEAGEWGCWGARSPGIHCPPARPWSLQGSLRPCAGGEEGATDSQVSQLVCHSDVRQISEGSNQGPTYTRPTCRAPLGLRCPGPGHRRAVVSKERCVRPQPCSREAAWPSTRRHAEALMQVLGIREGGPFPSARGYSCF